MLADSQAIVIATGGGGVPAAMHHGTGLLRGVEAVVAKDLVTSLLARGLHADALLLLTDVAPVIDGYGTPQARPNRRATGGAAAWPAYELPRR
jgi:carbamate kinase